jgi:predicted amidophosphoribosyltransferase
VAGAFEGRPGAVAGRRVLLVDDVTTTGATLDACARVLLAEGGASAVWGLTFARED